MERVGLGSEYLKFLSQTKISPTFWCSDEYFDYSEFEEVIENDYIRIFDGKTDLVPPLFKGTIRLAWKNTIWSSWEYYRHPFNNPVFLDYEFIYDPKDFLTMKGKNWATFRKNCRKFPRRYGDGRLAYINLNFSNIANPEIETLILKWMLGLGGETIHDFNIMKKFLIQGKNRKVVLDIITNTILGINVWDENYKYVNFRYCLCDNIPFLSEYMRWLFYTDTKIQKKGKNVNDGGCLGSKSLYDFKMKLNPISIRKVYSWEDKNE